MNPNPHLAQIAARPLFWPLIALMIGILFWDAFQANAGLQAPPHPATYRGSLSERPLIQNQKAKLKVKLDSGVEILLTASPVPENYSDLKKGAAVEFNTQLKKPRSYKNPGGFDYARYLERRGIALTGFIAQADSIRIIQAAPAHFFSEWEQNFKSEIRKLLDGYGLEAKSVLIALLWGEETDLSPDTETLFRHFGLSHLLVISGLHFALLALLIFKAIRLALKPWPRIFLWMPAPRLAAAGTLLALTGYYFFCESSPSVTRAYIAVTCYLTATLIQRSKDALNILFLAAILILALEPADLFNPSFQFSFLAAVSLLFIYPTLKRLIPFSETDSAPTWRQKLIGKSVDLFLVNFSVFIGLTPFLVYHFHELNSVSLIMNLWAVPLIEMVIVPVGLIALALAFVSMGAAQSLLSLSLFLTEGMLRFLKWMAPHIPEPNLVFPPHGWELALYAVLVLAAVLPGRIKARGMVAGAILIVFAADIAWLHWQWNHSDSLKVTQLDVGQGDAILVRLPGPHAVLIDGGGSPYFDIGKNVLIPYLLHERIPRLDAVILTHSDSDHYLGLSAVLKEYPEAILWWNGAPEKSPAFDAFAEGVPEFKRRVVAAGDQIPLTRDSTIEALWPTAEISSKDNNRSLVLKLTDRGRTALFTGDIEKSVEAELVRAGLLSKIDYLKVAHHGSRTSSTEDFLNATSPKIASLGAGISNRFGHPHLKTIDRFERMNIPLYRTDRDGAIEVEWAGEAINVKKFNDRF